MKLLTKTSLQFITAFVAVFFATGIIFVFFFRSSVIKNADSELKNKLSSLRKSITAEQVADFRRIDLWNDVQITEIQHFSGRETFLRDTFFLDDISKTYIPFRVLSENTHIGSKYYRMTVTKSMNENNAFIEKMTLIFTLFALSFIGGIYFVNRFFFKQIWSDFFSTLERLKEYDLNKSTKIRFNSSSVQEFEKLNSDLASMLARIEKDFVNIKEFSDDLTHEIQTPIAVIRTKAEMMLQNSDLSHDLIAGLQTIRSNAAKLFDLNKTLILLTKIENNSFEEIEQTPLTQIIEKHLEHFSALADLKKISIERKIASVVLPGNPRLLDILSLNLLKNAFTHAPEGGKVHVYLSEQELIVKNSGPPLSIEKTQMFERFVSGAKSDLSMGLGLAIVKKIVDYARFSISYDYIDTYHTLKVVFFNSGK